LAERLRAVKRLAPDETRRLAEHLFAGLHALHEAGIVHRDIKPGNILRRADGLYKITDFSLAALRDEPKLTHHRAIIGTPAYMSPEQAAGRSPDETSDLFAAGVELYESATGANPFASDDLLETLRRVRQIEPPFDAAEIGALSAELRALIRDCLRKERRQRLPSAAEALTRLRHVGGAAQIAPRRAVRVWILSAVIVAFAAALLLLQKPFSKSPATDGSAIREAKTAAFPADTSSVSETSQSSLDTTTESDDRAAMELASSSPIATPTTPSAAQSLSTDQAASAARESTDVCFEILPWAHVYLNGRRLGTTPMRRPLRLPAGEQTLSFRHPALPEITVTRPLRAGSDTVRINLAEHAAMMNIEIVPWGDILLDGETLGSSPLAHPLFFRPGTHSLRVTHPTLPAVEQTFEALQGDTLAASADLDRGFLLIRRTKQPIGAP
ncbi:MAG: serine/threonine-protein kinase, partial [bacterium]|nr:serine/threonine-protein kinase [bacterium]